MSVLMTCSFHETRFEKDYGPYIHILVFNLPLKHSKCEGSLTPRDINKLKNIRKTSSSIMLRCNRAYFRT